MPATTSSAWVAGALATHAEAMLAGMSAAQQALARAVLARLVTPERTRAPVSMTELHALRGARCSPERGAQGADATVELVRSADGRGELLVTRGHGDWVWSGGVQAGRPAHRLRLAGRDGAGVERRRQW